MAKKYYLKRYPHLFYIFRDGHKRYGYRYTYYDNNHKRHETSHRNFSSLKAAIQQLDDLKVKINAKKGKINYHPTIKQWIQDFIASNRYQWKPSTYRTYVSIFKNFIKPTLGQVKVADLNKSYYQRYCINVLIQKGLKHNTLVDVHHRMVTLMNAAVDNDLVTRNKISGTKIPATTGKIKKRIMTADELRKFNARLDQEPLPYQVIFHTLEDTGMREGELLGLKWNDLDFAKHQIKIYHTRDANGYRSPKTSSSKRIIGMSSYLVQLLTKFRTYQATLFKRNHQLFNGDSFLITDQKAYPLSNTSISRNLGRILVAAGLGYLKNHFTAHTFRHMFASYLLNNGLPLTDVSHALGHANPQITLSIYTEKNPGVNKNLGNQIEKIYQKKPKNKRD